MKSSTLLTYSCNYLHMYCAFILFLRQFHNRGEAKQFWLTITKFSWIECVFKKTNSLIALPITKGLSAAWKFITIAAYNPKVSGKCCEETLIELIGIWSGSSFPCTKCKNQLSTPLPVEALLGKWKADVIDIAGGVGNNFIVLKGRVFAKGWSG